MEASAISLRSVRKRFRDGDTSIEAVHTLDLDIPPSVFWVLKGPSGSGKTTLLGLMSATLSPTSGDVLLLGDSVTSLRDHHRTALRRSRVGVVFQQLGLIDGMTALENTLLPQVPLSGPRGEARARALTLLSRFGLAERADARVERLSGGQRQRLGIARALYMMPSIIIFDEATSALDGKTEAKINLAISDIAREVTVIMVTHRLSILKKCENIVLLDAGSISDAGNYDELIERSELFNQLARPVEN